MAADISVKIEPLKDPRFLRRGLPRGEALFVSCWVQHCAASCYKAFSGMIFMGCAFWESMLLGVPNLHTETENPSSFGPGSARFKGLALDIIGVDEQACIIIMVHQWDTLGSNR